MSAYVVFGFGWALLFALGAVIAIRLPHEYRERLGPNLETVAAVWAFYAVHFGLVIYSTVESTWHLNLPTTIAMGGGIALMVVGGLVYLSAAYAFRSLKRASGLDRTHLVTGGVYGWSRNPQLVGWVLVLLGFSLLGRSAMVLLLALIFWLSYRIYLPLEEQLLQRLFGETYEVYRRRTPRYFGPQRAS